MIRWRRGTVASCGRAWPGAVELAVDLDGGGQPGRARAHPLLVGDPQGGDAVLLNATALSLGLGTGGYARARTVSPSTATSSSCAPGQVRPSAVTVPRRQEITRAG